MAKKKKASMKIKQAIKKSIERGNALETKSTPSPPTGTRATLQHELGRLMHEISKQQTIYQKEGKKLKGLQEKANAIDEQLTNLDG